MPLEIPLYFDFISPYAWLALMKARGFAEDHGIIWRPRPVVYGALLSANGLTGPAESPRKRRYTFLDAARLAQESGLSFQGPPGHPFRSLDALRVQYLFQDSDQALELAVTLANACWGQGRDLTDTKVLKELVTGLELNPDALEERITTPDIKEGLRAQTESALEQGVFGVPSFVFEGELFWGQDRLPQLSARLKGLPGPDLSRMDQILSRPYLVERRREKP